MPRQGSPDVTRLTPGVAAHHPTTAEIFEGFLRIGLSGFGGVMPFARRTLVEQHRWLTEMDFVEMLSLSQLLPGPNIVNLSIIIGRRFRGVPGAIAATLGLLLMPMIIVLLLAMIYAEFAQIDAVRQAAHGVSAAASGLILSTALKMSRLIRHSAWQIGIAAIAFVAIGIVRLPLFWVIGVLGPLSLAFAWWKRG